MFCTNGAVLPRAGRKRNSTYVAGLLGAAGLVILIGTVGFFWDLRRRRRAAAAHAANVRDLIPAAPSGVWRGAQVSKQGGEYGFASHNAELCVSARGFIGTACNQGGRSGSRPYVECPSGHHNMPRMERGVAVSCCWVSVLVRLDPQRLVAGMI